VHVHTRNGAESARQEENAYLVGVWGWAIHPAHDWIGWRAKQENPSYRCLLERCVSTRLFHHSYRWNCMYDRIG